MAPAYLKMDSFNNLPDYVDKFFTITYPGRISINRFRRVITELSLQPGSEVINYFRDEVSVNLLNASPILEIVSSPATDSFLLSIINNAKYDIEILDVDNMKDAEQLVQTKRLYA